MRARVLLAGLTGTILLALAGSSGQAGSTPALQAALEAELDRAMTGLQLPDQPRPYLIQAEVLDGDVATARASFGALQSDDHDPYRNLRAEVRVGSYDTDSSNFEGGFGERDGVVNRALPIEDVPDALRREIWMALDESYKGATEMYAAKSAARQGKKEKAFPDYAKAAPLVTAPAARPTADAARIRELVVDLSGVLSEFPALEDGRAIGRDWQGVRLLVSSEGSRAWIPTGFAVLVVQASTRAPDGAELRDARTWVVHEASRFPPIEQLREEVRAMGAALVARRDAPVEENYLGPVLFEQPAAVELFRQLVVGEITGTPPVEAGADAFGGPPESQPTARIGRRLLPEGWTVWDDPTALPGEAGSYAVDFEGVPAQHVDLVVDGVVRDLLMSRIPRADRAQSNGHGRALGVDRRGALPGLISVGPRKELSARALARKAITLARQAGAPYAVVISHMLAPSLVNAFEVSFSGDGPLSGLTPPTVAWRLYPDGRREAVRGLSFVGVDRRVLRDIVAAGEPGAPVGVLDGPPDRSRFNLGEVGGLPMTWIVPPVLIDELELHGSGGGERRVLPAP